MAGRKVVNVRYKCILVFILFFEYEECNFYKTQQNYSFRKIYYQEKRGNTRLRKFFIFAKLWDTSPSSNGDEK
jgi:hypothetical protein